MLNIIILMESSKYNYHITVSNMIHSVLQADKNIISILDLNSFKHDYECLHKIMEVQPNVLITLDLAGFGIRTQTGETALNMLPTKNLNLIWGNKLEYASFLNKKISLSMLFYDVAGIDNHLSQIYPNLLYYKALDKLPVAELNLPQTIKNFQHIWTDFVREALLS